ncbi:MAG TPA: SipW-dependent-type signal peptide-containing protein [Candidatus Moranbacteria bacterium]|nr:SipW-dependent-type signal peptide-containing protein [Candidatus Moranbacteria bacterium]HRY28314.1 SipW-dependent-type signal peptide-containing protein [Candidatus Moranbacteria bacterium]
MSMIFRSLFVIAAVAAVAGVGTYALWTSQASVTGNTFSTGTMNLYIDADQAGSGFDWQPTVTGIALPDYLYPGYRGEQILDLRNKGSVNGNVTFDINRTSNYNELSSNLKFDVYYNTHVANASNVWGGRAIVGKTLSELITLAPTVLGNLPPTGEGSFDATTDTIGSVKVVWYVDTSAGNEIQGDQATFDVVFGLSQ